MVEVAKRSYGVDVSSHNNGNYSGSKFAVVKVSEGLDYRNPKAQSQVSTARANRFR
ncbi:GH25 family lysozyme [Escherichia coli]